MMRQASHIDEVVISETWPFRKRTRSRASQSDLAMAKHRLRKGLHYWAGKATFTKRESRARAYVSRRQDDSWLSVTPHLALFRSSNANHSGQNGQWRREIKHLRHEDQAGIDEDIAELKRGPQEIKTYDAPTDFTEQLLRNVGVKSQRKLT